jgi:hypothetical protein
MIVTPDCIEAEPVRQRLMAAGYEEAEIGFGPMGEVWRNQATGDVQSFVYCRSGDRSKFLAQTVIEAGV